MPLKADCGYCLLSERDSLSGLCDLEESDDCPVHGPALSVPDFHSTQLSMVLASERADRHPDCYANRKRAA